jgi:hypothetical protein
MYKKLNDLQFVIGLFFSIVSAILLINVLFRSGASIPVNIYTGSAFLVFGLLMMFIRNKKAA